MLERLTVRGFKSLREVIFHPAPRLSVLFGPNAAGKSNLLEAAQALAAMAHSGTFDDALGHPAPVRGHSFEAFSLPPGGVSTFLRENGASVFTLEADFATANGAFRYRISPRIQPVSGDLGVAEEYLGRIGTEDEPAPVIETLTARGKTSPLGRHTGAPGNDANGGAGGE